MSGAEGLPLVPAEHEESVEPDQSEYESEREA